MTTHIQRARAGQLTDLELISASKLFDAAFYLAEYPDVAAAADPYEHYLTYGGREGRRPSAHFDGAGYLSAYEDVCKSNANPLVHYLRFGQYEGRLPFPMDIVEVRQPPPVPKDSCAHQAPMAVDLAMQERTAVRKELEESGLFSAEFYCDLYLDIDPAQLDPLDHYIDHGWRERRRPHPEFDEDLYLADYPDVAESGMMPLLHFIRIGRAEGRRTSLTPAQWSTVAQMLAHAVLIEPTILLDDKLAAPRLLTLAHSNRGDRLLRAWKKLYSSLDHAYDYVVMMPWLVRGGADLAACNAIRTAIKHRGVNSVLVVLTDHDKLDARDWLPAECHVRSFSELDPTLSPVERTRLVEMLIVALRPKAVLNVNSRALWELTATKGGALKKATDLYAYLFCRDYLSDGRAAGYADTHYKDSSIHLKCTYFDNQPFLTELVNDFGLPKSIQERMVTVRQPIEERAFSLHAGGPKKRNSVLWAGRFSAQKNVDLLVRIARLAPEFDFHVYGYGELEFQRKIDIAVANLPNFFFKGPFASTAQLPLDEHNVLLYTSLYDGLPLTLAEVAASGIPLIASNVGGIPDLLNSETGWPVQDYTLPEPYVKALREIQADYDSAHARGKVMSARIRAEHSADRFEAALLQSPSFLD